MATRIKVHQRSILVILLIWLGFASWNLVEAEKKNSTSPWAIGKRSFADVLKDTSSSNPSSCKVETGLPKKTAPPYYTKLPRGAKPYQVKHVYDGDTLTLKNGKRVRLLGIDTPELKPPQPLQFREALDDLWRDRMKILECQLLDCGIANWFERVCGKLAAEGEIAYVG